jgi:hypothetical protein
LKIDFLLAGQVKGQEKNRHQGKEPARGVIFVFLHRLLLD